MGRRLSEHAAVSVKGSFFLIIGNSISLVLNAAGVILVALMLTPSEYGLFTITLVLPTFFNLFSSWGIDSALVQYIARSRSQNKTDHIENIVWTGIRFKLLIGGSLSLILFLFADVLSSFVLKKPEIGEFVRVASLIVMSQSIHSASISVLAGFEKMDYRAIVNVIQSLVKGVFSPLLVYLGYGIRGVVVGHTLSYVVAALVGLSLVASLTRSLTKKGDAEPSPDWLKQMLDYGLPLYIGSITTGVAVQFRGFLLSWFIPDNLIGNYGVASWFSIFIGVIGTSLGVTFFSTFSKYDAINEPKKIRDIFQGSIRYSTLFLSPLIFLFINVSRPIIYTIFGGKYPFAPLYLSLLLIPSLFVGIGSLSVLRLFNSQGDTRVSMNISVIGSITTILLSLIFAYIWNMEGLLFSYIISGLAQNLLAMLVLKKKYNIGPDLRHTVKTLLSSFLSGGLTFSFLWFFSTAIPLANLLISIGLFILSYLFLAPIMGALDMMDIRNLDAMFRNLKIIYPFARIILDIEEMILNQISK